MDSATPRAPTREGGVGGCGSSAATTHNTPRTSLCHSTGPRKVLEPARGGGQGQLPGPALGCVFGFSQSGAVRLLKTSYLQRKEEQSSCPRAWEASGDCKAWEGHGTRCPWCHQNRLLWKCPELAAAVSAQEDPSTSHSGDAQTCAGLHTLLPVKMTGRGGLSAPQRLAAAPVLCLKLGADAGAGCTSCELLPPATRREPAQALQAAEGSAGSSDPPRANREAPANTGLLLRS